MLRLATYISIALACCLSASASAGSLSLTRTYGVDAGGRANGAAPGLSASATYRVDGMRFSVTLRNTSTSASGTRGVSNALLSTLAFDLPEGVSIASGDGAHIAQGSRGVGGWADRGAGDSVADEWSFTEGGANGMMRDHTTAITTDSKVGRAQSFRFNGQQGNIRNAFGGLISGETASLFDFNGRKRYAVESAIVFDFTLTAELTADQLVALADSALAEFGRQYQYLSVDPTSLGMVIPLPGTAGLAGVGVSLLAVRRRR